MRTVGCVPYVNAAPLVWRFKQPGSPVRVLYDVPSRLPAMLEAGQADAVLASSYDALATPGRRVAAGVGICSNGPVASVRLFSRVPFADIETLALDSASLTSNHLAQILLGELHGVRPRLSTLPPDQSAMLAQCDACVLIGDIGMRSPSEGLYVMDLGEAWTQMTGLPFVWAMWIGGTRLDEALATTLEAASRLDLAEWEEMVSATAATSGWPLETVGRYLRENVYHAGGEEEMQGLALFGEKMLANKLVDLLNTPDVVEDLRARSSSS